MSVKTDNYNISTHDLTKRSTFPISFVSSSVSFQLTTSRRGRRQFLRKKFSFPNYFLCLLHIIYSYYINTIFFSTLFLQNLHFFWCESPRIFLFTYLSHSAFCSLFILILLIIEPLYTNFKNLRHCPYLLQNHLLELIA